LGTRVEYNENTKKLIESVEYCLWSTGQSNITDYYPFLRWILPEPKWVKKNRDAIGYVWAFFMQIINQKTESYRKEEPAVRAQRKQDFLDVLLEKRYTEEEEFGEKQFDNEFVVVMLWDMFAGGTDTTATSLTV